MELRAYCLSIVDGPSLEEKLAPPPADMQVDPAVDEAAVVAASAAAALRRRTPARDSSIALATQGERLPKLSALRDPAARAACLSRFAHHELCAVELFAWALLAFPALPAGVRRGFLQALVEEQLHCRLYLERLAAHGVRFGGLPLSDYFWKHVPAIAGAAQPPLAFLCAMGLTLEQANLDFTLLYRDAFRAAGDEETARVLQRVHDDEIGHVKLAVTWVRKLAGQSDVEAYLAHAPFPFSLARAKARRFDASSRRKAALSDEMIAAVAAARPYAPRAAGAGADGEGAEPA